MSQPRTTSFDGWVLRMDLGELARDGHRIRLQDQPLQVLEELLAHPGELVTREQLIARLWPKGVVDFDTGLNSAVRKLRVALQDDADTPRYIETVPRKGYRFICRIDPPAAEQSQASQPKGSVEAVSLPVLSVEAPSPASLPHAEVLEPRSQPQWRRRLIYMTAGAAALAVAAIGIVAMRREPVSTPVTPATESVRATLDGRTIAILPLRAPAADAISEILAQSVTDLLRNRLAAIAGVVVIANSSSPGLKGSQPDLPVFAEKLHAQFFLQGTIVRAADRLRMEVEFVDAVSGSRLWSAVFNHSATDAALILEDIAARVVDALHIPPEPAAGRGSAPARIDLDSYQLYVRGQQLMSNQRLEDTHVALELFRRATILDPTFARGYLALAQAHVLAATIARQDDTTTAPPIYAEAGTALDRALELNPALGEAWVERARFTKDPVKAEELFRKGLQLAPNYGVGYMRYAEFLMGEYRKGEAIDMMDRARQIDPLTPRLHLRQAFFLMVGRSDVAGHDRLVREALAINPQLNSALIQLAHSRYGYSGETADGIRIIEQSIALDPQSAEARDTAAMMYLDVDDPVAATAVLGDSPLSSQVLVEIAQYRRDWRRAAQLSRSLADDLAWAGVLSPLAAAVRDDAIATGDYASALKLFESHYATGAVGPGLRMSKLGVGLVYAHTLLLAGETQRGRKLIDAIMVQMDSESVGRTENWFSRERAAMFAMLGENERALQQLAASLKLKQYPRWWYVAEHDPVYADLRRDPRFLALAEQARKQRIEQRALVEEMRRKGEVPMRTAGGQAKT